MPLLSTILQLTPTEPTEAPTNLGRATHAWFMDRVTAHDHLLAKRLHKPNAERPFTVSDLIGGRRSKGGGRGASVQLLPGLHYALRVTSYSPELTELLEERVWPEMPETVSLAGCRFMVERVITRPEEAGEQSGEESGEESLSVRHLQPWVGRTTFEALVAENTLQDPISARVMLDFASPTVFKSKGAFMPLPLPRLVFEGLVRRWNAFSPVQVHPDVNQYADETLAISSYRLHTETVRFGKNGDKGVFPGFVGQCTYVLRQHDRYWMGLIHLLSAFAFYAGVGKETTRGMGQCRVI